MKSEGRYEIEAAKARLAAARDRASSAKESVQLAETMLQHLKSQLLSTKQEIKEAETCLKAAERRWEVIDISDGGDSPAKDKSNKRRKVVSPWGNNGSTATAGRGAPAPSYVGVSSPHSDGARQRSSIQQHGNIARLAADHSTSEANGVGPREGAPSRTVAGQASTNTSVRQPIAHKGGAVGTSLIIVNGAGTSNVNGTYYENGKSYGGASSYQMSGVDEDGEVIVFSIVRRNRRWWIGSSSGNRFPTKIYYRTVFANNAERPPLEEPWGMHEEGIDPAPNLQNGISGNNIGNASSTSRAVNSVTTAQQISGGAQSSLRQGHSSHTSSTSSSSSRRQVGSSSSSGNSQQFHLTDAAKLALRQAVQSAIDNPNGEIEPRCLQLAMAQGLPKLVILNAAVVARSRDQRNREQRRLQQQQQHNVGNLQQRMLKQGMQQQTASQHGHEQSMASLASQQQNRQT